MENTTPQEEKDEKNESKRRKITKNKEKGCWTKRDLKPLRSQRRIKGEEEIEDMGAKWKSLHHGGEMRGTYHKKKGPAVNSKRGSDQKHTPCRGAYIKVRRKRLKSPAKRWRVMLR